MLEYLIPMEELMARQFPEQEWVIDGLIPAGSLSIWSGPPANFKTWMLLTAAICVAEGRPLFERFPTHPTNVLIIDEENGDRLLQQRLKKLCAPVDLPIYFYYEGGFTASEENIETVLWHCQKKGIGLVIIDSLVRIHTGDENKSGDMAEVFKTLRRLSANGIAVVLTHHNRKPGATQSGANEMRGSSDILASIDVHMALTRKEDTLHFKQTKQPYAKELSPFSVQIVADDDVDTGFMRFVFEGDEPTENKSDYLSSIIQSVVRHNPRIIQREILESLIAQGVKTNEHKVRELLGRMVARGDVEEIPGKGNTKHYRLPEELAKMPDDEKTSTPNE